jgi:hypothetical protein
MLREATVNALKVTLLDPRATSVGAIGWRVVDFERERRAGDRCRRLTAPAVTRPIVILEPRGCSETGVTERPPSLRMRR